MPDARVRDAAVARALALPSKPSNGGRGTLQLVLRQARSDLLDFPRDSLIVGWSDCELRSGCERLRSLAPGCR